jgi:hypothetical protein
MGANFKAWLITLLVLVLIAGVISVCMIYPKIGVAILSVIIVVLLLLDFCR